LAEAFIHLLGDFGSTFQNYWCLLQLVPAPTCVPIHSVRSCVTYITQQTLEAGKWSRRAGKQVNAFSVTCKLSRALGSQQLLNQCHTRGSPHRGSSSLSNGVQPSMSLPALASTLLQPILP